MKLGMIGLGRMGAHMAQRLIHGGHQVVGFDPKPETRRDLKGKGVESTDSLAMLVSSLPAPRTLWLMIPSGEPVDGALQELQPLLAAGDTIVDGGNSNYKDTLRRARIFDDCGVGYVDCGTSGGVWGMAEGYSMMIGGSEATVERLRPVFEALAPAKNRGWGRVGPVGAGHFTKMVHNGIEYGLMQAYAEGFTIMEKKESLDLNLPQIAEIWRYGSVVRSWLLDLTADALQQNPTLDGLQAYVSDSGEGRWTVFEAIDLNVSAPVITESLIRRIRSREENNFTDRMLSIMRNAFGGHAIKKS